MGVVIGVIVGNPGFAAMQFRPAQFIGGHFLAGGGLDQRRAAQKDRPVIADMDHLVAHGRDIGAAGRAQSHDGRNLGDAHLAQHGLVVEHAPAIVGIRENFGLQRQVGPGRVQQVDHGQAVFHGDDLAADGFLHGHGIGRPAFDRRVVGRHEHLFAGHQTYADDDTGLMDLTVIHALGCQRPDFQKRRVWVQQQFQFFRGRQLAVFSQSFEGFLTALVQRFIHFRVQIIHQGGHGSVVFTVLIRLGVNPGFNGVHGVASPLV